MNHRLRRLAKAYLVPPGWVDVSRQALAWWQRGRGRRHWPQYWRGTPLPADGFRHAFHAVEPGQLACVTVGSETRVAFRCRSGQAFELGPFSHSPTYLLIGVAPASPHDIVRDLSITVNGQVCSELRGTLPADTWTNVRIHPPAGQQIYQVGLRCEGSGGVSVASPLVGQPLSRRANNVLVVIVDSLMSTHLGCYDPDGKTPSFTPNIDRFFKQGLRFTNAFAQSEWTLPSSTSMLTGLYAIGHGNYNPSWYQRHVPRSVPTWPELLQQAGYRTFCYSAAARFQPAYGFHRGFDRFMFTDANLQALSETVVNTGIEFIETHRQEPWACYLHLFESHPPFGRSSYYADSNAPPSRWPRSKELHDTWKRHRDRGDLVEALTQLQRAKLQKVDLCLGSLFNHLTASGLVDQTTVILLSDHGPAYDEGTTLLTAQRTHIPLLVRAPGRPAGVVNCPVEPGVDLYPTVLRAAGLDVPAHAVGKDLLATGLSRDRAVSESLYEGVHEIAIRTSEWCYMARHPMDPLTGEISLAERTKEFLFRRNTTTGQDDEAHDLRSTFPDVVAGFREQVVGWCGATRYFDARSIIASTIPSRSSNGVERLGTSKLVGEAADTRTRHGAPVGEQGRG